MNNSIPVYTKSVYGRLLTYPADAAQAIALQTLTGTKTLEFRHLKALQDLGFTIEQVTTPMYEARFANGRILWRGPREECDAAAKDTSAKVYATTTN